VPSVREDQLLNWNLEDESPNLIQEEDPVARVRRQAGYGNRADKLQKIKSQLGPDQSFVNAYFFYSKISKSYDNSYARFCKTFLSEINRTFVSQLAHHFSNIWKVNSNFAMVAKLSDAARTNGDFVVSIVIPPYCTLAFNDCSVMQALGFDVVAQPDEPASILRRMTNDELPWYNSHSRYTDKSPNLQRKDVFKI
jgi:hypothetical protein